MSSDQYTDGLDALLRSIFAAMPDDEIRQLASRTRATDLPAGQLIYDPEVAVMGDGLMRAFIADGTGRQVTVSYLRRGGVIALAHLAGRHYPTAFQAIRDSRLFVIGDERTLNLQSDYPLLAWQAARELSTRIDDLQAEVARLAFGTLRQRLAHHLLELTADGEHQPIHLIRLANAVGSPREVISRTLSPLSQEGTIRLNTTGITIINRRQLQSHAQIS